MIIETIKYQYKLNVEVKPNINKIFSNFHSQNFLRKNHHRLLPHPKVLIPFQLICEIMVRIGFILLLIALFLSILLLLVFILNRILDLWNNGGPMVCNDEYFYALYQWTCCENKGACFKPSHYCCMNNTQCCSRLE